MSQKSRSLEMALWMILLPAISWAGEGFPYEAFIAIEGAEVVSGPGHRYYATARLARGTAIEVYREETSGWLAIRPPEGSFSWTPAEFVERADDDDSIGRVTQPTPAWIGTAAEKVKQHRQLVTLNEGELVKILGEKQVEAETEQQPATWLKIAPPAGEFRWVHLRDVSRQLPDEIGEEEEGVEVASAAELESLPVEEIEEEMPRRRGAVASAIALRDIQPFQAEAAQPNPIQPTQYRSASEAPATRSLSPDGFVPRKRKSGSEQLPTGPSPSSQMTRGPSPTFSRPKVDPPILIADARAIATPRDQVSSAPAASAAAPPAATAVDQIADQLERLDLELSLMVAQNRSTWNLAGLRERTNELVEKGDDPAMRGRARLLLDKIRKFEETFDVQSFGPLASGGAVADGPSAASAPEAVPGPSPADPRYDGQGWLKPVVSRQSDKPVAPFALVDAEGKPVMFVTPSPGMNLNRYLNRQVGIYGRRGYIAELKSSHVTVERVIDIDKQ